MNSLAGLRVCCLLLATVCLAAATGLSAQVADELPLVRVPAPAGTNGPMILLLTGDGDWAAFVRDLAQSAAGQRSCAGA
jgi:type IV secretory pathway VirJ component